MIYLDHNATTPVRPEVVDAMLPWLKDGFGNPSAVYALGQKARAAVEAAREKVAALIGAQSPDEIVFTSGGSESDVLGIGGAAWQASDESGGKRRAIVSTRIEHDAVRALLSQLRRRGFAVAEGHCGFDGVTEVPALSALLTPETSVLVVMHANNETGVIQPVAEAAAAARAAGALVHVDAVQSAGKLPIDVRALGADTLAISGHKLNAPKGVGALYVRKGARLSAVVTGHQEKNRRGGTENVAAIVALGAACELARKELPQAAAHALALRRALETAVLALPGAHLNGHPDKRLPNTSHFSFDGLDGHSLVIALDLDGVCVSSGPACSAGAAMASHVLTAMGVPAARAAGSLRVSTGWGTKDEDVSRFSAILAKALERLRAAGVSA
jgi:cysteine desulfurase